MEPVLDFENGDRLGCSLVNPARSQLGTTGNADLQSGRIGQINIVRLHAVGIGPLDIPTGSLVIVAGLGPHDTQVTFSQIFKAGITIALGKTPVGFSATGNTEDIAGKRHAKRLADMTVDGIQVMSQRQPVVDGVRMADPHFSDNSFFVVFRHLWLNPVESQLFSVCGTTAWNSI